MFPNKLHLKLEGRKAENALRQLAAIQNVIDFSSNDYLGFSKNESIFNTTHLFLKERNMFKNGATGSRLLSGNHKLYAIVEAKLATFHNSNTALIFNSGYDANMGFFSSIPQRGDVVLYDEYIHASIRDGVAMSHAKAYKFKHNNLEDLEKQITRHLDDDLKSQQSIYVVTESVFSMDGDSPDLKSMIKICKRHKVFFIVDEAHAVGVFGNHGEGLIQQLQLEESVFARIITFGKALGCHGAAILGSEELKQYLINFSRSFIYTTALPPHSLATIYSVYQELAKAETRKKLHKNIQFFKSEIIKNQLQALFIKSNSSIHCCVISGNDKVKIIAKTIQNSGYDVKPILSPTVTKGQERLRFCLHAYNSENEISKVLALLSKALNTI